MPGETQPDPTAAKVAALAHTPAGPALATALAALDLSALTGSQCVHVLKARYRQSNHERGQLFAAVDEVLHRAEAKTRAFEEYPGEFAADEVRAALVLTRRAADDLCDLAERLVRRLPAVQQALAAGVIDQPRARVFSSWTSDLSDEHTEAIIASLLPAAPTMTTAQLIHEIKRRAIALDPNWARRRYERALKGRRVGGSRNDDGTANLTGYDLPLDQVAAACARLDRLAVAAKKAGHPDPIDHLRADLFLGMTDGSYAGLTDDQILHHLLTHTDVTKPAQPEPAQPQPSDDQPSADQPADAERAGGAEPDDTAPTTGTSDAKSGATPGEPEPASASDAVSSSGGDPGEGESGAAGGGGAIPARGCSGGRSGGGGLRLLVGLATLVGVDSRPGELIGWGPVHAELARAIAAAAGASWWYVLTGAGGAPLAIGRIRSRPAGPAQPVSGNAGVEVWVQVSQATLNGLLRQSHLHGWDEVIAEIDIESDTRTGPPNGDPARRLPGAALRRWIRVRDRTCVFPGCRVPAHRADADHTTEHANGGDTVDTNLGSGCRHDHRLRHDGGWAVIQPVPGHFTWTSRLGHDYHRKPPPGLDELPDPMPTAGDDSDEDDDAEFAYLYTQDWRTDKGCMESEPPPKPPPPPPPPPSPEDDIPPF